LPTAARTKRLCGCWKSLSTATTVPTPPWTRILSSTN